jgi:hypothetical protein
VGNSERDCGLNRSQFGDGCKGLSEIDSGLLSETLGYDTSSILHNISSGIMLQAEDPSTANNITIFGNVNKFPSLELFQFSNLLGNRFFPLLPITSLLCRLQHLRLTEGFCCHHYHLKCSRGTYPFDSFVIVVFDQRE